MPDWDELPKRALSTIIGDFTGPISSNDPVISGPNPFNCDFEILEQRRLAAIMASVSGYSLSPSIRKTSPSITSWSV
jgi:hypothetical protein